MTAQRDVVSYTTYAVVGHEMSDVVAARDRFFGGDRATSTLVTAPALARSEWKVEVAVSGRQTTETSLNRKR